MTVSRLVRILAVVLVAFALWRTRAPSEPARVAVLAFPGAAQNLVSFGGSTEPAGEIRVAPATSGASFWRHLVAVADADLPDAEPQAPLWSGSKGQRGAVRAVGVPARLFTGSDQQAAEGGAFLGSSAGTLVEAADISTGRLPFPYDRAVDAVSAAVGTLGRDQWSDWIALPAAPGAQVDPAAPAAEFQLAHYTDTTYYFSPAYIGGRSDVVGDAFLSGLDRELRPLVAVHVTGLARRRLAGLRDLYKQSGDGRPAIVFEDIAEDAGRVFAPDSTPSAVNEQVREILASTLASLRESVGPEGIVLVVGGPPSTRQAGTPAWYRIVRGSGGDSDAMPPLDLASAATVVRYLSGVTLDASEKPRMPAELAGRYPVRPTVAHAAGLESEQAPSQQWTASALEAVPGAVGSGN